MPTAYGTTQRPAREAPVRTLILVLIVLAVIALVMFILGRRRI